MQIIEGYLKSFRCIASVRARFSRAWISRMNSPTSSNCAAVLLLAAICEDPVNLVEKNAGNMH